MRDKENLLVSVETTKTSHIRKYQQSIRAGLYSGSIKGYNVDMPNFEEFLCAENVQKIVIDLAPSRSPFSCHLITQQIVTALFKRRTSIPQEFPPCRGSWDLLRLGCCSQPSIKKIFICPCKVLSKKTRSA
jgi:hypothetical protein